MAKLEADTQIIFFVLGTLHLFKNIGLDKTKQYGKEDD